GHDGLLAFLHDEETAAEPDQRHDAGDQPGADAGAAHVWLKVRTSAATAGITRAVLARAAALRAEQPTQFSVEVAPELVEIRGAVASAVGQVQISADQIACARRRRRRS